MSKYSGYMDKVAKFDLTTGKLEDYPWSDKEKELYLGGKSMAAKILYDHLTGKEEALSEENVIVISTGPLTGTGAPSSGRFNISAISAKTGTVASANCGGTFGYYLKRAGYDALVLTGKCPEHSWLEIYNDTFTLRNADNEDVWGKRPADAEQQIRDLLDRDYGCRVKCGIVGIGTAGEELGENAGVFSRDRAEGSSGIGAVFGWKNLKAVAVSGNKHVVVSNEKKTTAWNKKGVSYLREHPITGEQLPKLGALSIVGTPALTDGGSTAPAAETAKGCLSCPIKCVHAVEINDDESNVPEKEPLALLCGGELSGFPAFLDNLGMRIDGGSPKAKADLSMLMEDLFEAIEATGQCPFTGYAIFPAVLFTDPKSPITVSFNKKVAKLGPVLSILNKHPQLLFFPLSVFHHDREMKYAVGMKMNLGKYLRCGERGYALERYMTTLFAGASETDGETTEVEAKDGADKLKKAYFAVRGWSKDGVPSEDALKKLGIRKGNQ